LVNYNKAMKGEIMGVLPMTFAQGLMLLSEEELKKAERKTRQILAVQTWRIKDIELEKERRAKNGKI